MVTIVRKGGEEFKFRHVQKYYLILPILQHGVQLFKAHNNLSRHLTVNVFQLSNYYTIEKK
jgi:hypothetical protein